MKSLIYVAIGEIIHIPGVGQLGKVLDTRAPGSKIDSLTLDGQFVKVRTKDQVSKPVEVLIPTSFCTCLVLEKAQGHEKDSKGANE